MQQLTASFGPWTVNIPSDNGRECGILDRHGNVIALVNEIGDAAIMAASKQMFEELINIYEIVNDDQTRKKSRIEDAISRAFQKVIAESDIG